MIVHNYLLFFLDVSPPKCSLKFWVQSLCDLCDLYNEEDPDVHIRKDTQRHTNTNKNSDSLNKLYKGI